MSNFRELAAARYVSLTSYRRDGRAVATPVWLAKVGDRLVVVSAGAAGKVKRIRATQRVTLAICDVRGKLADPAHRTDGRGRVVDPSERELLAAAHAALRQKYGWQMWLLDVSSRLSGRYHERAYLEIALGSP